MKPSDLIVLSESIPSLLPLLDRQSSSTFIDWGTRKFPPLLDEGRFEDIDDRLPIVPSFALASLVSDATTFDTETDANAGVKGGLLTLETLFEPPFSASKDLRLGEE